MVCTKPLCKNCLVVVEGKGYCKQHGERLLLKEQRQGSLARNRVVLYLASILAVLDGLAGVVVGFLLITLGLLGPSAQDSAILQNTVDPLLTYFANVLVFPPTQAVEIGFALMVLGTADMIAGYYLWRRSRIGAIVSIAVTVIAGGLLGGFLIILALAGAFTYVYIVSAVIKLLAIGYSWRQKSLGTAPKSEPPAKRPERPSGSSPLKKGSP
ncbi:MAG: hypothetical protein OK449_09985 [Thaumarchaeota archaeon]|nr:hypothetical protein [Nitrososphaerota archaeon]